MTEISHSENITQDYYSTPYPLPKAEIEQLDLLGAGEAGESNGASATGLKTPDGKEVYEKNGRPVKVTVKCGGTIISESLENFKPDFTGPLSSMVYIEFDEPVYANRITVVISEAVGGTQYEDMCIAELFPYAHSYVAGNIK